MKREQKSPRYQARRLWLSPRWWLPVSILVSVAVHLAMIPVVGRLLLPPAEMVRVPEDDQPLTVQLSSRASDEKKAGESVRPKPSATPLAAPKAPVSARPTPGPRPTKPTKTRVAETAQPERRTPPPPITPVPRPSTPLPEIPKPQRVAPAPVPLQPVPGRFADHLPLPLPRGDLNGSQGIVLAPPRTTLHKSAPSPLPLPPRVTAGEGGRVSGAVVASATPDRSPAPAEPAASSGARSDNGPPTAADQNSDNGLGITRGIPFGDVTGLSSGGNPNGGGPSRAESSSSARLAGQPLNSQFASRGVGAGHEGLSARSAITLRRTSSGGGPPVHIVYVIDTSGSMEEGNKIGQAKDAMRKALDELRPEDSFNIVVFSDTAKLFSPTMRPATSANINAGCVAVDVMEPNGSTNLSGALDLALAQPDVTHIFVLSDGEPTEGITDFGELLEFAREKNAGRVRIITLALGLGERFKGIQLLRELASENRGRFDYINLARK